MDGGASTIIDAILENTSSIFVPTFYYDALAVKHPYRIAQNGFDYKREFYPEKNIIFSIESNAVNDNMGILPKTILLNKNRFRGYHPSHSFSGLGVDAKEILDFQQPTDVFGHLLELSQRDGFIILMGVGLNRMTLIHLAEKLSGRNLFKRWALDLEGKVMEIEVGSCSEGFFKFDSYFEKIEKKLIVGGSQWRIFKASNVLEVAIDAINTNGYITHCGNSCCVKCNDMVSGGSGTLG